MSTFPFRKEKKKKKEERTRKRGKKEEEERRCAVSLSVCRAICGQSKRHTTLLDIGLSPFRSKLFKRSLRRLILFIRGTSFRDIPVRGAGAIALKIYVRSKSDAARRDRSLLSAGYLGRVNASFPKAFFSKAVSQSWLGLCSRPKNRSSSDREYIFSCGRLKRFINVIP